MSKLEKTFSAWSYRLLLGPAMIVDGLIFTISFTMIKTNLALECARRLSKERFNALQ